MLSKLARRALRPAGAHDWRDAVREDAGDSTLTYQSCSCGTWRVLRSGRQIWMSATGPCADSPELAPAPRGWPHRKAYGEASLFLDDRT